MGQWGEGGRERGRSVRVEVVSDWKAWGIRTVRSEDELAMRSYLLLEAVDCAMMMNLGMGMGMLMLCVLVGASGRNREKRGRWVAGAVMYGREPWTTEQVVKLASQQFPQPSPASKRDPRYRSRAQQSVSALLPRLPAIHCSFTPTPACPSFIAIPMIAAV